MSKRTAFAFSLVLGLGLLQAAPAFAFCRTNSCDPARGETCSRDSSGCLTGGVPLFWASSCVTYAVQRDGSTKNNISAMALNDVVAGAFDEWTGVTCEDGGHPSIGVTAMGPVDCGKVEYNKELSNANIYMFRDDTWTGTGANALALTTVWFDWKSGQIYDADVEINGTGGDITNGAPQAGSDLPSIITHESGHFLGLDHSNIREATMDATYTPRVDNLRILHADDIAGICAIYPSTRKPSSSSCTPRHGFSGECGSEQDTGCSVAKNVGTAPVAPFAVLSTLGLALVTALRRRRA